ncbi:uncharacterized protein EV422DRAFT_143138 [Fimicolochytrium jonesii]|uniref:uncharacterized protein n=1 Tax=Fimicolochytrium jonesii TaxID=1396493 RepID=UPI0022FE823B|nr:uncharacterized protein EV422DRAFT_143138 [Fimicolochytrium jonesii]KAI8825831.1 hypothetical protein EV422DRAFT_143138 [Fimicolochytrium jonesii]
MSFRKRDLQAGSGSNGCDSDSNSSRDSGGGGRSSNDGFMGQGRSSKARQRSPLPFTTKDKEAEVEAKEATDQMGSVCPAFALAAADPSMSSDEETGDLPMAMPANFSVASQKRGGLAGRSFSEADPKTSNMGLPSASYSVASQKRGGFAGRTFSMIGGSSYSIGTNRSSNTRKPPKRKPSPFMVIPDAPHVIAAREALKPNASNSVGELGPRPREGSVFDLGIATSLASIESEARPARGTVVDEIKVENGEVSDMPVATISPTEEGSWTLKRICIEAATMPLLMMISLFTYCPFCIAVVVQSTVQGHAVNTDNWKEEVHGWSWLIGLTVFGGLLIYPIRVAGWLGSIENASGDGMSLKVGGVLAAFLCILVAVQILTAQYAFLKPGLGIVTFPANKSLDLLHWRNILPLVSPLFDFVQFTSLAWRTRPSDSWVCASPQLGRLMHILIRVFTFRFAAITCASIMADESSAAAMKETLGGLNATVGIDEMLLSTNPAEVNFAGAGVAFGFCTIYALLLGYAIAKLLQPGHWLCGIVFEIFAGLGYMPIVSRLLALLSCRPYTLSDGKKILYLADSDNSLVRTQCFTGGHKKWGGMALAGLLLFGLSAIFVGSYKGWCTHTKPISMYVDRR